MFGDLLNISSHMKPIQQCAPSLQQKIITKQQELQGFEFQVRGIDP